MRPPTIFFNGARLYVRNDMIFVWRGGHTIIVLDEYWNEIDVFNVGNYSNDLATEEEVLMGIQDYVKKGGIGDNGS